MDHLEPERDVDNAEASTSVLPPLAGGEVALSKNAMKRAAKQAKMDALKPVRRQAERLRRQQKHGERREAYAAGTMTPEEKEAFERARDLKRTRQSNKKKTEAHDGVMVGQQGVWKGGVVIDLDFDELMTDQEITSMKSQLGYVYSANRIAPRPFSTVLHTSFSPSAAPRIWENMRKSSWEKWNGSYWWAQGIETLAQVFSSHKDTGGAVGESAEKAEGAPSLRSEGVDLESHLSGPRLPPSISIATHSLVYLSADAEEELETLREDEIYIIGGIVDRNRHKMLCQNKATKLGIRTARLPIGTYLETMATRKVLTVNQVFSILVEYIAHQSWSEALEIVIPKRKFEPGKKSKRKLEAGGEPGTGEDEEMAEPEELDEEAMMNA
ncbi:tRNA (guanine9-N1)-methyltransferase, partial [Tremellales sp. Uapishka_1]